MPAVVAELARRQHGVVSTPRCPRGTALHRPDHNLNMETDGKQAHLNPIAFEDDRERDVYLQIRGIRVVRFTFKQIFFDAEYITSTLARLLQCPAAPS